MKLALAEQQLSTGGSGSIDMATHHPGATPAEQDGNGGGEIARRHQAAYSPLPGGSSFSGGAYEGTYVQSMLHAQQ